jgi:uncharacterized membrane protein YtjA (UPF0391 family)
VECLRADGLQAYTCLSWRQALRQRTPQPADPICKETAMLHYTVVFLVVALIAAVFGFGGIAAGAVEIARILFFIFALMAVVSFIMGLTRKN